MSSLYWLDPYDDGSPFPDVEQALREPDGLLAVGGSLTVKRLTRAYRNGIFPWYSEDQPILWWSPNPRAVLFPTRLKVSRSLRKTLRRRSFRVSLDQAFPAVIRACAEPRGDGAKGTWITEAMIAAYESMHRAGLAHSVEVWRGDDLVGGLYGVAFGRVFFGESMFSRMRDMSKIALVYLTRQLQAWGYAFIDCQVHTEHLVSLGAQDIPRHTFIELLDQWCDVPGRSPPWTLDLAEPVE